MKFRLKSVEIDEQGNVVRELEWEDYDKPELTDANEVRKWSEGIHEWFNSTCRPNEKHRRLLKVEVLGQSDSDGVDTFGTGAIEFLEPTNQNEAEINTAINAMVEASGHDWQKSNLVTIVKGHALYDQYQCTKCGITARRLGVRWPPVRDAKYKAKVYENCDTAQRHIAKRNGVGI